MKPPFDMGQVHELVVSEDADRLLVCPQCQYKAVMEGGKLIRLVPGDPQISHLGAW